MIGLDVKNLLRSGVDDEKILSEIKKIIYNKPREHFFNKKNKFEDKRKMYQVGG